MQRGYYYDQYEAPLAERLTTDDVNALDGEEDGWIEQARAAMSADQFSAASSQFAAWKTNSPAYRILAYFDRFGGIDDDVPLILTNATGWSPADFPDSTMAALFGKADDAITRGSLAGTQGGNTQTGQTTAGASGGIGILVGAALLLWILSKK